MHEGERRSPGRALEDARKAQARGDILVARSMVAWVLTNDPQNVKAWLHMAELVDDRAKKLECYRRAVAIDPQNSQAMSGMRQIEVSLEPTTETGPPQTGFEITDAGPRIAAREETDPLLQQLEASRQELLDLSLNNKLLNHRNLKTKGVEIIDELSSQLLKILVEDGRSMSFLASAEKDKSSGSGKDAQPELDLSNVVELEVEPEDELAALGQPDEADDEPAARHTDNKLQTPYSSEELQRRLLNTYHNARTYIEEQGVNTLFLACGMLEWYESKSSDLPRKAPLILVPVELSRTNVTARFRLEYTGEDIGENLSLRAKLLSEFGLILPDFPDVEDLDLVAYSEQVEQMCHDQTRWIVHKDEIALGFFSYAKFLMFKDLDSDAWPEDSKPTENRLMRGLLEEGFAAEPDPLETEDLIDDLVPPGVASHVLDADSSQALAILDASKGKDLVIHGPPGTGKSQTIANLIAEALAEGKTVLFVSEKLAALEVVKRRLDHIGIGDSCLELHSRKTKKKAFLDELERCIQLGRPNASGDIDVKALARTQAELNAYARAVNDEIGKSKVTAFEAYGLMIQAKASLAGTAPPKLVIDQAETWPRDKYHLAKEVARQVQSHLARMGVPSEHPFFASEVKELLPGTLEELRDDIEDAREALSAFRADTKDLASELGLPQPQTMSQSALLISLSGVLQDSPDLRGIDVTSPRWLADASTIDDALERGAELVRLRGEFDSVIKDEAWGASVSTLQETVYEYRTKLWRLVSSRFRSARSRVADLVKIDIGGKPDTLLRVLNAISREADLRHEVETFGAMGSEVFGARWQDTDSQWEQLREVASYLLMLHSKVKDEDLPPKILQWFIADGDPDRLRSSRSKSASSIEALRMAVSQAVDKLGLAKLWGVGSPNSFERMSHDDVMNQLDLWGRNLPRLQEIVTLKNLSKRAEVEGIGQLLDVATSWNEAGEHLVDLFDYAVFRQLVNRAFREHSEISDFDGAVHETKVKRFADLDRNLLRQNQVKLALKHYQMLPKYQAPGQLAVLSHEFQKKRRHMPIRKLMEKAGNVIQTVKPIFMMSPLSIAMYLPPGTVEFDEVIFDEASQVKPVDAFGAILRGKQIIVAGDNHQLPPTSFFETSIDVDEDYSDSVTVDLESVLGLSLAKGVRSRMLNWHYRSEHESLIAVSNHEFYDDHLVIFPSPDKDKETLGLVYHHLPNAVYDRGRSRKNHEEAEVIAQAVMDHARQTPDLTLGVAAFSISQANAVRERLEILRRNDPSQEVFFRDHPEEQFFVKNLENVQGDERDVIFISVGYGRTADGRVSMNFGPLNREGGERRLNVLITRARKRCEVFTNLEPGDIDLKRTNAKGVEVLKRFLAYAKTGELDVAIPTGRDPDSPFEIEVARKLRDLGYEVEYQVGEAGFFIDLGIVDPAHPGRYVLGIECDGATYHSARSARERDRLRQEILERLGWRIHRIWSTDWVRDPDRELRKAKASINRALAVQDEESEAKSSSDANGPPRDRPRLERAAPQPLKGAAIKPAEYISARVDSKRYKDSLHEVSANQMAAWIDRIVKVEGPVHIDEAARRILDSAGVKRLGRRIRANFDRGVAAGVRAQMVEKRGKFLWPPGASKVQVRSRVKAPASARSIDKIPPEEIAAAIRAVVQVSFGIARDDIPGEVCSLFGFRRTSQDMSDHVDAIIARMVNNEELVEQADYLTLPEGSKGTYGQ